MHYPIAIQHGDHTHAFGVMVPDLPGCFSAGDTLEEAITNAAEAIALWIEDCDAFLLPVPSSVERWVNDADCKGWTIQLVEIRPR